jgi:hypothetical protein
MSSDRHRPGDRPPTDDLVDETAPLTGAQKPCRPVPYPVTLGAHRVSCVDSHCRGCANPGLT